MRTRYFSFLSLAVAAAFLVVASQSFVAVDIANVAFAVSIGMLVCALGLAWTHRPHLPTLITSLATALISAWMIVETQVFSLGVVQNITFADALAISGLAIIGMTAHELSTERVVHSLQPLPEREPALHNGAPERPLAYR